MVLYRAVRVEDQPKSGYDWAQHKLSKPKLLRIEKLQELFNKNGYPIDNVGKTNGPGLPQDFFIVPFLLNWVGAKKVRPKENGKIFKSLLRKVDPRKTSKHKK